MIDVSIGEFSSHHQSRVGDLDLVIVRVLLAKTTKLLDGICLGGLSQDGDSCLPENAANASKFKDGAVTRCRDVECIRDGGHNVHLFLCASSFRLGASSVVAREDGSPSVGGAPCHLTGADFLCWFEVAEFQMNVLAVAPTT